MFEVHEKKSTPRKVPFVDGQATRSDTEPDAALAKLRAGSGLPTGRRRFRRFIKLKAQDNAIIAASDPVHPLQLENLATGLRWLRHVIQPQLLTSSADPQFID